MNPEIGSIVAFRGVHYKVICNGDVRGTFDLFPHPDKCKGDIWRNVPPSELTVVVEVGQPAR